MTEFKRVPIQSIDANPLQPRQLFREEELSDLASSIRQYGVLQPLVVTLQPNGRFRLVAGERRWRAAKLAGLGSVPVAVRSTTSEESLEIALVENIQRQDLNPMERARAYDELIKKFNLRQEQVAKKLGKSRAVIANALRLLSLPDAIQKAITDGRLSEGHAKIIAGLETKELQMKFFERVVQTGASVRETEEAARRVQHAKKSHLATSARSSGGNTHEYRNLLESTLGTKVNIVEKQGRGSINVEFYSEEELEEIVRKILGK